MTLPLEHTLLVISLGVVSLVTASFVGVSLSSLASEVIVLAVRVALPPVLHIVTLVVAATDAGTTLSSVRSSRRTAHVTKLSSGPVRVMTHATFPVVRTAEFAGGRIVRRTGWQTVSTAISRPRPRPGTRSRVRLRLAA